jgi:hypothetical protein
MKKAKLTILIVFLGLVLCQANVSQAAPISTAFTYQGHLYDANYAADGLYDFQFKLYDANSGGVQLNGDINAPDIDVIDGYFTVELDFGSDVFDGNAAWLEIGVRPGELNDPCVYTILTPRQEITPTPYALQTRGIFVDDAGNIGIGTNSPGARLEVNGDLKVTGAYKGNIGPNNGAPFPRPAYDSGWIDGIFMDYVTIYHNIGGDPNNYVVHSQDTGPEYEGICNKTMWQNLTSTSIQVRTNFTDGQVRVRIWVYN